MVTRDDLGVVAASNAPGTECIAKAVRALYGAPMRQLLATVTGIQVSATPELAANVYQNGSHHMPKRGLETTRRLGFLYFLVPEDWSVQDGGAIEFLPTSPLGPEGQTGEPGVLPTRGALLVYETTSVSWHRIAEVVTQVMMLLSNYIVAPSRMRLLSHPIT